jgi:hypothetical protein
MRYPLVTLPLLFASACQVPQWRTGAGARFCFEQPGAGQPVATYLARANPHKPYLLELRSPQGHQILRDSPADHVHHHGLMFALVANGTNFWEEHLRPGREETTSVTADGPALCSALLWRDDEGTPLLEETRELLVVADDDDATALTWRTALAPTGADVTLTGAHYHGLGLRFVPSFDGALSFLHPAGAESTAVRGSERLGTGAWAACTGAVDGHEVTVVMMSHPDNRPSTRWFTMVTPFAYLSATADGWQHAVPIAAGRTLEFVFGVLVLDGHHGRYRIEACYERWLAATRAPRTAAD